MIRAIEGDERHEKEYRQKYSKKYCTDNSMFNYVLSIFYDVKHFAEKLYGN